MRQISNTLLTAFQQAYNVRPVILLRVDWGSDVKIYSTQEVDSELGTVYPFVKEFSNFDALTRIDGFGATNSLTVSFFDQSGHFKEYFDTVNIYDVNCRVYLSVFGSTEAALLFEGKFGTPVTYDPDTHVLSTTIESEDRNQQLCYTPSIDDVDDADTNYLRFEQLFTSQVWPDVFGNVAKMELKPLVTDLEFEVAEDLVAQSGVGSYTMKVRGDLLDTITNGSYVFNVIGSDSSAYNLLITGTLGGTTGNRTISFTNANVTNHWYASKFPIACERLDSFDSDDKIRLTRVRMTTETEPPWLVGMYIQLEGTHSWDGGSLTYRPRVKVVDQVKNSPSDDYENTLIIPLTWVGPITQINYASISPSKPHTIKEGSTVVVHSWDKRGIYVVDNKYYSDLNDIAIYLYFNTDDKYRRFPPFTYDVYSTNGSDSNKLWTGAIEDHPPCTYVKFDPEVFGRMIVTEKNLSKGEGGQKLDTTVAGDITTPYNTDSEVIENLLTRYTSLGFITDGNPKTCNFALTNEEDITTIVPEVAWQKNKAVRETVEDNTFKVELIDLNNLGDSVFSFTADNIHSDPITLSFTQKEDLKTVFKVTIKKNDETLDLVKMVKKSNISLYGKTDPFTIDYYAYNTMAEARENINYWIDKLSTPYLEAEFTGYLDAIALEVWDVVDIDFGTINFYDPERGLPYDNYTTVYDSNIVVSGQAVIREINIDIQTGLIKFKVQFLNKTIGNLG